MVDLISSPRGDRTARDMSVTLHTNLGDLKVELFCEDAPRTCENFLALCASEYYDNTSFHRNMKGFMIQGGDPTGTGRGGASIWGGKFEDEITRDLKHTGAGIICMANSGPNTNGSQFYITLAPTPWLDGKHTIFGRVSAGITTVARLGKVRTDARDKPAEEVKIMRCEVLDHVPAWY